MGWRDMVCRSRAFRDAGWLVATVFFGLAFAGCGAQVAVACKINTLTTSPQTAIVDHSASSPRNTQRFDAFIESGTSGCLFVVSSLSSVTWSVSDPAIASISNAHDATNGTATCKAPATGAVTVTAMAPAGDGRTVSSSASLTCN